MERPTANAEHLQADHFLGLLNETRRRSDRRFATYQRARALAEAGGHVDLARGLWGLMYMQEQERQVLDELIDRIKQGFPRRDPGEVRPPSRRALYVVR